MLTGRSDREIGEGGAPIWLSRWPNLGTGRTRTRTSTVAERQAVLGLMREPRFVDLAPAEKQCQRA